jgi:hypothetical protein
MVASVSGKVTETQREYLENLQPFPEVYSPWNFATKITLYIRKIMYESRSLYIVFLRI